MPRAGKRQMNIFVVTFKRSVMMLLQHRKQWLRIVGYNETSDKEMGIICV